MAMTDPRGGELRTHTYQTKDGILHEVHTADSGRREERRYFLGRRKEPPAQGRLL